VQDQEVFGVAPPCEACEVPELWPENQVVWEVFKLVARAGDGLSLDLLGLLDRLQVKQPLLFLRRLQAVWQVAAANARRVKLAP